MFVIILACLVGSALSQGDPELELPTPGLIEFWGYPSESHWVTTEDGYILGMHRIPHGINYKQHSGPKPVVLLQHGLEDSSSTWVINSPEESLGFMMADAGFDVWMGNIRGNTYSKDHTTLDHRSAPFWQFSFDEMALVDLPTMINYVLNTTSAKSLSYFGHSQGTLMGFLGFSQNQHLASKVNVFGALAPVARITHVEGMMRALSIVAPEIEKLVGIFGVNEFAVPTWIMETLVTMVCPRAKHTLCENIIFLGCGFDTSNMNATRVPRYAGHCPAGTSSRNIIHWAQLLRSRQLQKYDYGSPAHNMKHYNATTPPKYEISDLSVPTALFAGGNDFLADPRDVVWLEGQLKPGVIIKNVFYDDYNHLDFVWGIDANRRVYDHLISLVRSVQH